MKEKALLRKITLLSIKYAPATLTLVYCAKIFLLSINQDNRSKEEIIVNWINWGIGLLLTLFFYAIGKYFGYCWKHRSLCRTALWGLAYYFVFMVCDPPREAIMPIVWMYVTTVLVFTYLYREL